MHDHENTVDRLILTSGEYATNTQKIKMSNDINKDNLSVLKLHAIEFEIT
jgi:hypothetical protein